MMLVVAQAARYQKAVKGSTIMVQHDEQGALEMCL